ncbi:MAG: [FeFe] hydrogenase H-cluster radical SAM maturase HydE [Candidatus Omnitrophota bacterium]
MSSFKILVLLKDVLDSPMPDRRALEFLLGLQRDDQKRVLFDYADAIRKQFAGDGILLRGIIEFSSYCKNRCFYCGLSSRNKALKRYRLSLEEILESAEQVASAKIKTVVLQSGEDPKTDSKWLAEIIKEIKSRFADMAVTLAVGERPAKDYKLWRRAGADRYLLKIETSDRKLYRRLHPGMSFENRLKCLKELKKSGYQVGSGNIIGLKGQTIESIARDIIFFKERGFEMIGIGPFIPHDKTELAKETRGDIALTLKALALTRVVTKYAHLPATTALGSQEKDFRIDGLKAGANVLMPNFTPQGYKARYEIYPGKRCVGESSGECSGCMEAKARSIGRFIDYSRGDALNV